ncbi:MAG: hypothetical protein PHW76_02065 [Alphaproteobacteria bacterium]|nr:hypothetical protein [Alphaproteobacteria bacterium]
MKKILAGLVVLGVVIVGAAYFLSANLDSIVRAAVEKYGTAATKTAVTLDSVKIVLASGEAAMGGLSIGSPEGFEAEKSLYLGSISVKLDKSSIGGNGPLVIKDITIQKPQITYEVSNSGDSNLQKISKNAQAYASSFSKDKKSGGQTENTDKGPDRKVVIESLTIREGQVSIAQALLKGKKIEAQLPLIHLTNIGKNENGASPAEVAQIVLGAVTNASAQVATSNLAKELGTTIDNVKAGDVSGSDLEKVGGQVLNGLLGK